MKILAPAGTMTTRAGLVAASSVAAAALVLLVRVEFRSVNGLHVFPQRRRVRVPLGAAGGFADVRFLGKPRKAMPISRTF